LARVAGSHPSQLQIGAAAGDDDAPQWVRLAAAAAESVLLPVRFPSLEVAVLIARRSILLRAILDVWGAGPELESCIAAVRATATSGGSRALQSESFRICISAIGCRIPRPEQQAAIAQLVPASGMHGEVRLDGPSATLHYIEDRGKALAYAHRHHLHSAAAAINPPIAPAQTSQFTTFDNVSGSESSGPQQTCQAYVVFGLEVAASSRNALLKRFVLSDRRYLG